MFDVRSEGPSRVAPLERENKQAWREARSRQPSLLFDPMGSGTSPRPTPPGSPRSHAGSSRSHATSPPMASVPRCPISSERAYALSGPRHTTYAREVGVLRGIQVKYFRINCYGPLGRSAGLPSCVQLRSVHPLSTGRPERTHREGPAGRVRRGGG